MRVVVQRVSRASVEIEGSVVSEIAGGYLLLVGVEEGDGDGDVRAVAQKIAGLRIFSDGDGKMNRTLAQAGGSALVVSQFTLLAEVRKGRRPSFVRAARPEVAAALIDRFVEVLAGAGINTETGRFGAKMKVDLVNDGPVTLLVESEAGRIV